MSSADGVSAAIFDELMVEQQVNTNQVLHVVVSVAPGESELGVDFLMQYGARAVVERLIDGVVELWSVVGDSAVSRECISRCTENWQGRLEWVDGTPSDAWKQFAEPVVVNSELVIIPSWKDDSQFQHYKMKVLIDPEESFGLGDHPTTRLVAGALCRLNLDGLSVLDMGSGSGVLSIVAALRGAQRVFGIDRALGAAEIAERNATRNGVADKIEFRSGSDAPLDEKFGVIAANILAPALLELSDSLVASMEVGGIIVLSGLRIDRSVHVVERYESLGCAVIEEVALDGWSGVVMKRTR